MSLTKSLIAGAAALALSAGAAAAATATLNITQFSGQSQIADALAAQNSFFGGWSTTASENFDGDGFTACPQVGNECSIAGLEGGTDGLQTGVGTFYTIGPDLGGSAQVAPTDRAVVRENGPMVGRYSVVGEDGRWLDSNDNQGLLWMVPGDAGFSFQKLSFFLTDVNDAGNAPNPFTLFLGDTELTPSISGNLASGVLHLVTLEFDSVILGTDNFAIRMLNTGTNIGPEGFGVDGFRAAVIPLPAPALLLLTGMGVFGGVAAMKRRREKAVA